MCEACFAHGEECEDSGPCGQSDVKWRDSCHIPSFLHSHKNTTKPTIEICVRKLSGYALPLVGHQDLCQQTPITLTITNHVADAQTDHEFGSLKMTDLHRSWLRQPNTYTIQTR
jgi:hypothetical protein